MRTLAWKISAICVVVAVIACSYGCVQHKNAEISKKEAEIATSSVNKTIQTQEEFDVVHREMDKVESEIISESKTPFRTYLDNKLPDDAIRLLREQSPNKL